MVGVGHGRGNGERPTTRHPEDRVTVEAELRSHRSGVPSPLSKLGSVVDVDPPYPGRFTASNLTPAETAAA